MTEVVCCPARGRRTDWVGNIRDSFFTANFQKKNSFNTRIFSHPAVFAHRKLRFNKYPYEISSS